jgi:hypothetical protein
MRISGKLDIRLGILVVEAAAPGDSLDAERPHLFQYMRELAPRLEAVRGIIIDGTYAEYYVLGKSKSPELKAGGGLGEVLPAAIADFCRQGVRRESRGHCHNIRNIAAEASSNSAIQGGKSLMPYPSSAPCSSARLCRILFLRYLSDIACKCCNT